MPFQLRSFAYTGTASLHFFSTLFFLPHKDRAQILIACSFHHIWHFIPSKNTAKIAKSASFTSQLKKIVTYSTLRARLRPFCSAFCSFSRLRHVAAKIGVLLNHTNSLLPSSAGIRKNAHGCVFFVCVRGVLSSLRTTVPLCCGCASGRTRPPTGQAQNTRLTHIKPDTRANASQHIGTLTGNFNIILILPHIPMFAHVSVSVMQV